MDSHPILSPQEFWLGCIQPRIAYIQNVRSLDKFNSMAHVHGMIEDELAAMQVAMCTLRTELNALVPVCRLPWELLGRIFLFCAEISPPRMDGKALSVGRFGWLQVTHVCKYWREAALRHPHLWTSIRDGLNAPWLKVVLARAKSAPISVGFGPVASAAYGQEISSHLSHIREIFLCTEDAESLVPVTKSILQLPANILEHLCLNHLDSTDLWLPQHVFQDHAPALQSIDLCSVHIPWSAPILSNLTHLRVVLNDFDVDREFATQISNEAAAAMSSFDQLLDALRRMPALETLKLSECLPPRAEDPFEDSVVDLPCLKTFKLTATTTRSSDLLKYLKVPSTCNLALVCTRDLEPQSAAEVVSFFHSHVDNERGPLLSLALEVSGLDFRVHTSRLRPDGETKLSYSLQLPHPQDPGASGPRLSPRGSQATIATLCHELPIDGIHQLSLSYLDWKPQEWVDVLGRCKAVQDVQFSDRYPVVLGFCAALAMHADEKRAPFLPDLGRLALDGVQFTGSSPSTQATFYQGCLGRLIVRQKERAIQKVVIKWASPSKQFISSLQEVVPEVELVGRAKA